MKKGGCILLAIVFASIFGFFTVSAFNYNVTNISLKQNYTFGDNISGSFLLNLTDAPADSVFTSELGQTSLRNVLLASGDGLSCESYNCSDVYSIPDSDLQIKQINLSNDENVFGFYLSGRGVFVKGLEMGVGSVFKELDSQPFFIKVADNYVWAFDDMSTNLSNSRAISYGCFSPSISLSNNTLIDAFGYCERISLSPSKSYYLGANISGSSSITDFRMFLKKNGSDMGYCDFSTYGVGYSNNSGCFLNLPSISDPGSYDVCIKVLDVGLSNYTILKENSGTNCGYYKNPANGSADYSIFAITPKYASSSGSIDLGGGFSGNASNYMNSYLASRYPNGCMDGCVVPISFYGQNVTLNLADIKLIYSNYDGSMINDKINDVLPTKARINFFDFISLDSFNWSANFFGEKNISIYLRGDDEQKKILQSTIMVFKTPIIQNIYPLNPPAGLDTFFHANILYNFTKLIWDFGDGTPAVTTAQNFVAHAYANVSQQYNINITAYGGNYSMTRSFLVTTVSPENYLNNTFILKRSMLSNFSRKVDVLPSLYRDFIKRNTNITGLTDSINQLDIERSQTYTPDQFVSIAQRLSLLLIPRDVNVAEKKDSNIVNNPDLIDPSLVAQISSVNKTNFDELKKSILGWELHNFDSNVTSEKLRVSYDGGATNDLINSYHIYLKSKADETAYFFIQGSPSNLNFGNGVSGTSVGNSTYFEIAPGQELTLDFFVSGFNDSVMFVSPKLSSLLIGENVGVCNFNGVCQVDLGENYTNCRSDCKPVGPTVFLLIIVFIFILTLYTLLQVWYKVRYEKKLFADRALLFNLVAFINNSKLRNVSYGEMDSDLRKKDWSGEQVSYAIKKANGKNTGMYELIPVEKILAYFAMKKAKKTVGQQFVPIVNPHGIRPPIQPRLPPKVATQFNPQNSNVTNFRDKNNFRRI